MKKKNENPLTLKIKYNCSEKDSKTIHDLLVAYNPALRYTYNRVEVNPTISTKDLTILQHEMNHISPLVKSHLLNSAQFQAKALYKSRCEDKPVIFGGRSNFIKRCQKKITHEEWEELRLVPLYSVGESNQKGNRLFEIIDERSILFKPNKNTHINIELVSIGKNYRRKLKKLKELANQKKISLTFQIDVEYIYITYDNNIFEDYSYPIRSNRVISIDMNPNFIGWSVCDWKCDYNYKLIDSGMFSLKALNDFKNSLNLPSDHPTSKYITNKRNTEIIEIAKQLFIICKHYHCEIFAIEELIMTSVTDDNFSDKYRRRLINNQWNRNLLVQQLTKHIKASSTKFIEVKPEYSSKIGNLVNRKLDLPDPVLASIEIGRRGFEFASQYVFKRRPHKKTIIFPLFDVVKETVSLSLEELGAVVPSLEKWESVWELVKNSELKYRVPLSDKFSDSPFSKFYKRKYLTVYTFK